MKSLSIFFLLFLQLCTKSDNEIYPKRDSIIGKWQLFETCISPGSACVLKKIDKGVIIEFLANGEYKITNFKENESILNCDGKWKFIEIQTNPVITAIEFSPNCNKALWTMYYKLNEDNTLNINPLCIEECRYTYKPI